MHKIYSGIEQLKNILQDSPHEKAMLVCDSSFSKLEISKYISKTLKKYVVFNEVGANPRYEDVVKGVHLFNKKECDFILAVGGGSVIDTAKCIKMFCTMDSNQSYLTQPYAENGIILAAIPTTAGTGSESTRFAVIYAEGEKQSLSHEGLIPSYVLLEPSVLRTLPLYQKKCAMLDALCQAMESWWSVNAAKDSIELSKEAVRLILSHMDGYMENDETCLRAMIRGANLSGRAINITQTTAAHAMSYKLTSLYGIPHGHAVALCFPKVWQYMIDNIKETRDERGAGYLKAVFQEMAHELGTDSPKEAVLKLENLLTALEIYPPVNIKRGDIETLADSVNPIRLKNNPVDIAYDKALVLYEKILGETKKASPQSA